MRSLHDDVLVPEEAVGVEVQRGVEPQRDALLPAADAVGEHICLHQVRLVRRVAQHLKIQLVVAGVGRGQLHIAYYGTLRHPLSNH